MVPSEFDLHVDSPSRDGQFCRPVEESVGIISQIGCCCSLASLGPLSRHLLMILTLLRRHSTLALVIVWLGLEIPFLPTAFRIDEPYYLAIAQQVKRYPADPYGFRINWLGDSETGFRDLRQSSSCTGLDRRMGTLLPSK